MLTSLFWLSTAAIVHHHITYPLSLLRLPPRTPTADATANMPSITIIVPAYQEAAVIEAKVRNLSMVNYPPELLSIEIHCDGCTDGTEKLAKEMAERAFVVHPIKVIAHPENRGKIIVLNESITAVTSDVVVLTDASAHFDSGAVEKLARHFSDDTIAAVGGVYDCEANGSDGEKRYWRIQNRLRLGEAQMDCALGLSGALFAFRRSAFTPMPADTINDDFILPMTMAANGKRILLDSAVLVSETERTAPGQDLARRVRIGAGNVQQMIRLLALGNPARPGLAYCFLSGKALRAIMPMLLVIAYFSNMYLAYGSLFYTVTLGVQLALYLTGFATLLVPAQRRRTPFAQIATLVSGHAATGLGMLYYLTGRYSGKWARAASSGDNELYGSTAVRIAKRFSDIVLGLVLFAVFAVLFIPIAIAIKLDSKGPIFYRQLRVGKQLANRTDLFYLIKFRTMRTDAEANGASWATKRDPRITRIGNFMRKTRLDELPQAINVLLGEMSMIGPRPERPQFFAKLENSIPLYIERTYGILPGITGLAQVRQGYDTTVEDVRNKVGWDHAYAARIDSFWSWLKTDISIAVETIVVMVRGRGQ